MFEIMGKKAGALCTMTQDLGNAILAKEGMMLSEGILKFSLVGCINNFITIFVVYTVFTTIDKLSLGIGCNNLYHF